MRIIFTAIFMALVSVTAAVAQERDSVFKDYAAYESFVDLHVQSRDFIPLIQALGGRDEYTPEQLNGLNGQLLGAFPVNFAHRTTFREEDLGGGLRQEARAYWTGESYAFFYALLHERDDALIVLTFQLHSSPSQVLAKF